MLFFAVCFYYVLSAFGITAGAHRLWAHRSYKAKLPLRIFLALCQSAAAQVGLFSHKKNKTKQKKKPSVGSGETDQRSREPLSAPSLLCAFFKATICVHMHGAHVCVFFSSPKQKCFHNMCSCTNFGSCNLCKNCTCYSYVHKLSENQSSESEIAKVIKTKSCNQELKTFTTAAKLQR